MVYVNLLIFTKIKKYKNNSKDVKLIAKTLYTYYTLYFSS